MILFFRGKRFVDTIRRVVSRSHSTQKRSNSDRRDVPRGDVLPVCLWVYHLSLVYTTGPSLFGVSPQGWVRRVKGLSIADRHGLCCTFCERSCGAGSPRSHGPAARVVRLGVMEVVGVQVGSVLESWQFDTQPPRLSPKILRSVQYDYVSASTCLFKTRIV